METAAQNSDQKLLQRIDLPSFIAGLVAGFLALSNEPWWTLTSPTNSHVLSIQVSPFYLQIAATGTSCSISTKFGTAHLLEYKHYRVTLCVSCRSERSS